MPDDAPTLPSAEAPPAAEPAESSAHEVIEIVQTVLTGIILAFVFRAFFVEGFVIPTGSMAESLYGRHGITRCTECVHEFAYGPANPARVDGPFLPPGTLACPNCRALLETPRGPGAERFGDRVLVEKWPYDLGGPFALQRWDVVVFRDPADVRQNYIKRLVGLPGEAVEIIDGDVYVGAAADAPLRIAPKTAAAQSALWLLEYDQDHPPAPPDDGRTPVVWRPDRRPTGWRGLDTRVLRCEPVAPADGDERDWLLFDPLRAGYGTDNYGYNPRPGQSYVGDFRVLAEVRLDAAVLVLRLMRDAQRYELTLDGGRGQATLTRAERGGAATVVADFPWRPRAGAFHAIEFGHLDRRIYVGVDGALRAAADSGLPPPEALRGHIRTEPVGLAFGAAGTGVALRRLRIERDVHYTHSLGALRGVERPFELGTGEYFVLGDNSPSSHDSREWMRVGRGAPPDTRPGVVPRDLIVGRAFFVYLPSITPLTDGGAIWLPDLGRVRWVR